MMQGGQAFQPLQSPCTYSSVATKTCMPKLGMEMTEGAVAAWLFKEGDRVRKGDEVVQVESEKITYGIEAPASGVLRKIFIAKGTR